MQRRPPPRRQRRLKKRRSATRTLKSDRRGKRERMEGREGRANSPYLANLAPDPTRRRRSGRGGEKRRIEAHTIIQPATCQFHLGPRGLQIRGKLRREAVHLPRPDGGWRGRGRATFWQLIMHAQALEQCMGRRRTRTKVDIPWI